MAYNQTRRRTFTTLQRAAFFERHKGVCYLCGQKIDGAREKWEIEHIVAREIMGQDADEDSNLALAHASCHRTKTRDDKAAIAKSNRVRAKHIGARPASKFQSRGFPKASPQKTASRPPTKGVGLAYFQEPEHHD